MIKKKDEESKLEKILEILKSNYITITLVLTVLQLLAVFQPIKLWYSFLLVTINVFTFLILKDFIEKEEKEKGFIFFKSSVILFIYNLLSLFGRKIDTYGKSEKSFKPMILLLGIGLGIGILSFFMNEDRKKLLNDMYEISLVSKLGFKGKAKKLESGDAIISINKETKEPVIIPFKDRFLHMLVLGPTGCGKTSQVIIPMIDQDIRGGHGITVIEPKGDLAEKVFAMAEYYDREAVYFNPTLPDCPYFNPLYGPEDEVIENMATTFKMLNPDSPQFFQDMNETLIRNALRVLKRLKGNSATLIDLSTLIYNSQGQGKILVNQFVRLKTQTVELAKENAEIGAWFLSDYFNERSKTYEHCSGLRSQVSKITSNFHLRRVLNPPNGENDVNFEKIIEEGKILAISTAQGDLRDLGRFLGYFIILNFQSSVFKRPGNEDTRRAHFLYIDEFQTYSNPGFADMLTQGRSYRVASHLATQNRALMAMGGGRDGQNFVELVSTNARNVIIFPGSNSKDAKFYSDEFGEVTETEIMKGVSQAKFNPLYGLQKIGYPNESIREVEVTKPRFSASEIIFKDFGEVIYRIIQNNSVQIPEVGIVSWIPKELNDILDEMVAEYNEEQERKLALIRGEIEEEIEEDIKNTQEADEQHKKSIKKAEEESRPTPKAKDEEKEEDLSNESETKAQKKKREYVNLEEPEEPEAEINSNKTTEAIPNIDFDDKALDDLI